MTPSGVQELFKTPKVAPTLVFCFLFSSFKCCFWMILGVLVGETYVLKHLENMVDLVVLFGTRLISSRSTSEGFGFPSHFPLNQPRAVGRVDMKHKDVVWMFGNL